ncbi:MAG: hypothetical protein JWM68_3363 [Verrucomicrobiales bacterium]|nr:hypothetical protein [Verrucomicrobiales bacterium]
MKNLIPVLALAFAICCSSATADVLVYNYVETGVITGNGKRVTEVVRAYFISDTDTSESVSIGYLTFNGVKYYVVLPSQDSFTLKVSGPLGASYTVLTKALVTTTNTSQLVKLQAEFIKGRDVLLKIKSNKTYVAPRTFAGIARSAENIGGGVIGITESTITATFNTVDTVYANDSGNSVTTVLDRYKTLLASKGYVPFL